MAPFALSKPPAAAAANKPRLEPSCAACLRQRRHWRHKGRGTGRLGTWQPHATARPATREKEEAGSVLGAALLVAGTAVGAGVLALPAVTQESGFLASAAALAGGSAYSVAIGLLLAELYVNSTAAARQGTPDGGGGVEDSGGGGQGSGGGVEEGSSGSAVFAEIARSTLGERGVALGAGAYLFLHVALLVAYISKSAEVVSAATGLGTLPSAALFVAAFGGLCYCSSSALLDRVNGLLVVLILGSFFGLLASAAPLVEPAQLLRADWGAVPATLPVIALAFVYHNVVPVICASLQGDATRIRTAIIGGVSLPLVMFILWDGAILGSLESLGSSSGGSSSSGSELAAPAAFQAAGGPAGAVAPSLQGQEAAAPAAQQQPLQPQQRPRQPRVEDPLAALSASSPAVGAEISAFSFLAVATSFIGFVLGLTDFVAGALALPSRQAPAPYLVALLPPLVLAVSFPGIFLTAIDTAGTYGVLTLFGILPCAMAWSARYGSGAGDSGSGSSSSSSKSGGSESSGGSGGALRGEVVELVPGGKPVLVLLAGGAAAIILKESAEAVARLV